jgi:BlaI family transcriptional regulator, penicillinase repressor
MELSRRERQIMDVLFRRGKATAADVQAGMPNAPSYSAVRAMLRTLENKGYVSHEEKGRAYVYKPTIAREQARKSAVRHLLTTFFAGSTEQAVAALLDIDRAKLTSEQLDRLTVLVEEAKSEGR